MQVCGSFLPRSRAQGFGRRVGEKQQERALYSEGNVSAGKQARSYYYICPRGPPDRMCVEKEIELGILFCVHPFTS